MIRILVLTSDPYSTASLCLPALAESNKIDIACVVFAEPGTRRRNAKFFKRRLKKISKIGMLGALNGIRIRPWFEFPRGEHLEAICERLCIPLYRTGALNNKRTAELFRSAGADLGLSLANSFISKRIFSIPRFGMINVHGERLPDYQNAQSIIWPIYNMERTTGFTVHQIDEKIDTGSILYQENYDIQFRTTLKDTVEQSIQETARRMPRAVRYVCENYERLRASARPQTDGRSYTTPSVWQFLRMTRNNQAMYASSRLRLAEQS